jgi:hypothetical protein
MSRFMFEEYRPDADSLAIYRVVFSLYVLGFFFQVTPGSADSRMYFFDLSGVRRCWQRDCRIPSFFVHSISS